MKKLLIGLMFAAMSWGQITTIPSGAGGVNLDGTQTLTNKTIDGVDAGSGTTRSGENKMLIPSHNTDCTSLTDGVARELCWEEDNFTMYICQPTAGGCDTAAEWVRADQYNTFAGTLNQVYDWYAENNSTNMDHKITSGDYIALIHHDTDDTGGFLSPTNALHTVTTGKVAVIVFVASGAAVVGDPTFRGMRLQNTTDSVEVLNTTTYRESAQGGVPRVPGDTAELPSVAAGKVIELQTWNSSAASRGRGGFLILKEVDAP